MKTLKWLTVVTLCVAVLACSSDDDFILSSEDLNTSFDENPADGFVVGTLQTNSQMPVFSIRSQSPAGAFSIDSLGVITVADATKFNFESEPNPTATIQVIDGTQESLSVVDVSLNDVDDIASFLSDSRAAYNSASTGDWILITEDEYELLGSRLDAVSEAGSTDDEYNAEQRLFGAGGWTRLNVNQPTMPNGSYLFAFKYVPNNSNNAGTKIKLSTTTATTGYMDIGNPLPSHGPGGNSSHFVLKGNATPTDATAWLSMYCVGGINGATTLTGPNGGSKNGDHNDLSDAFFEPDFLFFYQGLSSTIKQWD